MFHKLIILLLTLLSLNHPQQAQAQLEGAWKSDQGVIIFAEEYFSFSGYSNAEFQFTFGGSWNIDANTYKFSYEYHTQDPEKVGTTEEISLQIHENSISIEGMDFSRLDDGKPGDLAGAWLFANRISDGQLGTPRSTENPRKTMKILSGTRFQWIAYNIETKEFMGTGGGTYTTLDGKYTENIDFFSRDNSRVGATLQFDYELKDGDWHHQGLSSKGEPIYEIWSLR